MGPDFVMEILTSIGMIKSAASAAGDIADNKRDRVRRGYHLPQRPTFNCPIGDCVQKSLPQIVDSVIDGEGLFQSKPHRKWKYFSSLLRISK